MPNPSESAKLRKSVVDLLAGERRALHTSEIASRLDLPAGKYATLQRLLDDLSFDGGIVALTGQRFRLDRKKQDEGEIEGFLTVNPRGFGFVATPGGADDVFIPAEAMRGAMHGDRVAARVLTHSRRGKEGEVVRIVTRKSARVAGTLRRRGKSSWLEPDDTRVRGPIVLSGELRGDDGAAAVATILRYPESPDENPEGKLEAVLGTPGDPNVEVAKVLIREDIAEGHSPEAVAEAKAYGDEVTPAMTAGREDLTGIPLPTIDPEDARDHDDAVWVVRNDDGSYKAWVAIADVSYYVRPGTALDDAAMHRGNSIYLPDRAIPMLPRELSSNLCSLLPNEIRLCMCAEIDLDAAGSVTGSRLYDAFMKSRAKLTYPGVARALGFTPDPPRSEEAEAMRDDLRVMFDLSRLIRAKRMRRGALDFDLPEAKVVLDTASGAPIGVEKRSRDPGVVKAYQLIEDLMLLANETVARFLVERDVPAVFRDHGSPDEAKLEKFASMCEELDVPFELDEALDPKKLSAFLKKISGHPKKHVLHSLLLRAMKQAYYDVANIGHFGLASSAYVHFTSPIRRYPDLLVHRGIKSAIAGTVDRSPEGIERLRTSASMASDCERKGMEIEREIVDLYRALYMRSHIGERFEGTVTALVGSGVFVNLDDPFVDVLVKMESLGSDSYEIDDEGLRVIGRRSGDRIAIGDTMLVEIEDVAILRRTVYARRIATEQAGGKRPHREKKPQRPERPQKKTKRTQRITTKKRKR